MDVKRSQFSDQNSEKEMKLCTFELIVVSASLIITLLKIDIQSVKLLRCWALINVCWYVSRQCLIDASKQWTFKHCLSMGIFHCSSWIGVHSTSIQQVTPLVTLFSSLFTDQRPVYHWATVTFFLFCYWSIKIRFAFHRRWCVKLFTSVELHETIWMGSLCHRTQFFSVKINCLIQWNFFCENCNWTLQTHSNYPIVHQTSEYGSLLLPSTECRFLFTNTLLVITRLNVSIS